MEEKFKVLYSELYNKYFKELEKLRKDKKKVSVITIITILIAIFNVFIVPAIWYEYRFIAYITIVAVILGVAIFFIKQVKKAVNSKEFKIINNGLNNAVNNLTENKGNVESIQQSLEILNELSDREDLDGLKESTTKDDEYAKAYSNKILKPLIECAFPNSEYNAIQGIPHKYYTAGQWGIYDGFYDSFDKIDMTINIKDNNYKFVLAQIASVNWSEDDHPSHLLSGMYGYVELTNKLGYKLSVTKHINYLFGENLLNTNEKILEFDNNEFNEIFDVKSDNEEKARSILNNENMKKLLELKNKTEIPFEFKVIDEVVYFKFKTKQIFMPSKYTKSMNYDKIKEEFDIVKNVKYITEKVCGILLEN